MCTCGIDIATQQAMLASDRIAVSTLVESRKFTRGGGALIWLRRSAAPISIRSTASASTIESAVKTPMATWVVRQPAVTLEPVRGFRHQGAEGRRRAEADGKVHQDELPDGRRGAGAEIAEAEDADADADRGDDAVAVGDFSGQDPAGTEAEHHHG